MKFATKLTILFISLSIIISSLIGVISYYRVKGMIEKEVSVRMENHIFFIIDELDHFLYDRLNDIKIISQDNIITSESSTSEQITERLIYFRNIHKCYVSLSYFNFDRIRIADTAGMRIGKKHNMVQYWEDVLKGNISAGSDIRFAEDLNISIIYFASPVKNSEGKIIGVVVARVPINRIFDLIIKKDMTKFYEEKIDIVNKEGLLIYSNYNYKGILKEKMEIKGYKDQVLMQNKKTIITKENEYLNITCKEYGYLDFEGNGWLINLKIPTRIIFNSINKLLRELILMFLFALFFMGVCIKMMLNLKESYSTLEEKVKERTKELEKSWSATLNIMKVLEEEKEKNKKQSTKLAEVNNELELLSKVLEDKVKDRTTELTILYEISNAISYTLDYHTLVKLIMESLFKVVRYDICAAVIYDAKTANITVKMAYSESVNLVDEVKDLLINSICVLDNEKVKNKHINTVILSSPDIAIEKRVFDKIRTSINVPFIVNNKTIGFINVASCKDNAFTENEIKFIYTIAYLTANAFERLQAVVTAEKSKMESMVQSMTEGVVMVDNRGEVVVINSRARQLLDFGFDEHITSRVWKEKNESLDLEIEDFEKFEVGNSAISNEITVSRMGEPAFLNFEMSSVKDINGKIIGIVTIIRDITKEKEIDRMKTEFISIVSHELRTPLSIIKDGIGLVWDKTLGDINEKQEKFLSLANNNINRLTNIINNLLDVSKIESGKTEMKKSSVNLNNLINGIIADFSKLARDKGLELKLNLNLNEKQIDIYADEEKIIQVFTNLISNSLKFVEKGYIEISVKDLENEVECRVADTGIGIVREDLPKAFGKFQQFNRMPGGGEKGTGLGLSIVKVLVEMHGGKIWIESQFGQGTKISFTLPKFTTETIINENVNKGIKEAIKSNLKMSIMVINFVTDQKSSKENAVENLLKDMEDVLKDILFRNSEILIRENKVIIIMLGCNKNEAKIIKGKLEQAINNYLAQESLLDRFVFEIGCATYPDEGRTSKDLIEKTKVESNVVLNKNSFES